MGNFGINSSKRVLCRAKAKEQLCTCRIGKFKINYNNFRFLLAPHDPKKRQKYNQI